MLFGIFAVWRPAFRRHGQLHESHGLCAQHHGDPVPDRDQPTDQARIRIRCDSGVDDRFVHADVLRRQKADHAGPTHGNAIHSFCVRDALFPKIAGGVPHCFFDGDKLCALLVVSVRDKKIDVIVLRDGLGGGFEHPPGLRSALEHDEDFFVLGSELVYLHDAVCSLTFRIIMSQPSLPSLQIGKTG